MMRLDELDFPLLDKERFRFKRQEVYSRLNRLIENKIIEEQEYKSLIEEDLALEVKNRTFLKCRRNLLWSILLLILAFIVNHALSSLLVLAGIILLITSLIGAIMNKLPAQTVRYLSE